MLTGTTWQVECRITTTYTAIAWRLLWNSDAISSPRERICRNIGRKINTPSSSLLNRLVTPLYFDLQKVASFNPSPSLPFYQPARRILRFPNFSLTIFLCFKTFSLHRRALEFDQIFLEDTNPNIAKIVTIS